MRRILLYVSVIVSLLYTFSFASEIHDAAKNGDLQKVKELISENPELVNEATERGTTPLHYACAGGNLDVVKLLISKGADVNALNDSHNTPLHYAAYYNQSEIIELLIAHHAQIETRDREGQTPLHAAASSDAVAAVKVLLANGADVYAKNDYVRTPLLLDARECGNIEIAELLLEKGSDINTVDESDDGALDLAAWRGFREFVNFLLDRGAKIPNSETRRLNLLNHSVKRRLQRLFTALLDAGLDLDEIKASHPALILTASSGGSTEIIDLLAKKGFDLNRKDKNGWTPLHCAAEFGRNQAVQYLLANGASVNARTVMGQSAFNIAQEEKNEETAALLERSGADTSPPHFPELKGEYLGQEKPGNTPVPFAPGIVSAHFGLHSAVAFSPDGKMAFWTVMIPPRESGYGSGRTLYTSLESGKWTYPVPAGFNGGEPFFSPDGKRLYFISREPIEEGSKSRKENIWFVERTRSGWSHPKPVDPIVNSASMHWQFSIDKKGTFYMGSGDGRILVSQLRDGRYQNPVDFAEMNGNSSVKGGCPYISPDGDYLLFSRDDDLHITFRKSDGSWTEAQDLGATINSPDYDLCPVVSPDGEYLFYITTREGEWGPHWVAIKGLIDDLRKKALRS